MELKGKIFLNMLDFTAEDICYLVDLLTVKEYFGKLSGIQVVYMGDARYNMGNSLRVICAKMGMDFTACAPEKYFPSHELYSQCQKIAGETGASITLTGDVEEGIRNADVIYTDVWVSMGEPASEWESRIKELMPYQVNQKVMDLAGEDAVFMHCLPAFQDLKTTIWKEIYEKFGVAELEVTDQVFEGPRSVVFDEAENRMHTIKAVIAATLGV